jgi:hypothetical protein
MGPLSPPKTATAERRRAARIPHEQPCKVYQPRQRRFVAGTTRNLSMGGAMIELNQQIPLLPGERVQVGLGVRRTDGFLKLDEMVEAEVLRAVTFDGRTTIALQYRGREDDAGRLAPRAA